MSDVLNLDFLLEKTTPVGTVEVLGEKYELFQADIMENFLTLLAMTDRVSKELKVPENGNDDPLVIGERMEHLRQELRNMIRVICPGMTEEFLREKFPKMGQLQKVFELLILKANQSLPESVKKNSEIMLKEPQPRAETAKVSS